MSYKITSWKPTRSFVWSATNQATDWATHSDVLPVAHWPMPLGIVLTTTNSTRATIEALCENST